MTRNQSKHHCVRCGKKAKFSKLQSDLKSGKITLYCSGTPRDLQRRQDEHFWTVKMVITKEITIKPNQGKRLYDEYNLKKMKCPLDGELIQFDRKSSFQSGGIIVGNCFKEHRVEVKMVSKMIEEPDCDEVIQIKIKDSKW